MIKLLLHNFSRDIQSIKMIKSSKLKRVLLDVIVVVAVVGGIGALIAPILVNADEIKEMIPLDLGSIALLIGFYISFMLAFVSSIGFLFSSAYLDKNLDSYVVLPIKTRDFTIAKMLFVYKNVMLIVGLVLIPFVIIYLFYAQVTVIGILMILFYYITMPIIVAYIVALIVSTILYFINKQKNKKIAKRILYTLVIGILIVLYFAFVLTMSFSGDDMSVLIAKVQAAQDVISKVLFYPTWAVDVFGNNQYIKLLYMLLAIVLCIPIQLYFEKIYFKSSIGFNQDNASSKRKKRKENGVVSRSIEKWFFIREFKELTKTPAYFFNSLFGNILIVVVYLVMMGFMYFTTPDSYKEVSSLIDEFLNVNVVILITVIIGTFFTLFNNGAATIFSRDAKNLPFIKTLPISYARAFLGKVIFHGLVEFLTLFIFMIIPMIVLNIQLQYIIVSVLTMLLLVIATIFIPVCLDLRFPTLDWESETALVKRGKSVIISMLLHLLLMGIVIGGGILLINFNVMPLDNLAYVYICFYIVLAILLIVLYKKFINRAIKMN